MLWKEDLRGCSGRRVWLIAFNPVPRTKDCYTLGSEWLSTIEPVHLVLLALRTKVAVFQISGTSSEDLEDPMRRRKAGIKASGPARQGPGGSSKAKGVR